VFNMSNQSLITNKLREAAKNRTVNAQPKHPQGAPVETVSMTTFPVNEWMKNFATAAAVRQHEVESKPVIVVTGLKK
jgi:UDP-N-acetylglucosamine:LPS N-acetylglucosamine transferase